MTTTFKGFGTLRVFLVLSSLRIIDGNLFSGNHHVHPIQLDDSIQHFHKVFVDKEIWNEANNGIRAVMVSREDNPLSTSNTIPSCSSPSAKWLEEQTASISNDDLNKFFDWTLYVLPFAYKLYIQDQDESQEYFGRYGQYTEEIRDIGDEAQDFWSYAGVDDVHLFGAHGSDLADLDKLIPTLELLFRGSYGSDYSVQEHATEIQALISRLPEGYNFPLLTFNAFATDDMEGSEPSIIIGDGYFEFQKSISMDSEGPEYALTHEFSHHLQYAFGTVPTSNGLSDQYARKQELMADAFSAYFLAHNNGGDMTADEISNIHRVAYSVGDCDVGNDLHHGTPSERRCATVWGAQMADSNLGRHLNALELSYQFDSWFNDIDDIDAMCDPILSTASAASVSNTKQTLVVLQAVIAGIFLLALV